MLSDPSKEEFLSFLRSANHEAKAEAKRLADENCVRYRREEIRLVVNNG